MIVPSIWEKVSWAKFCSNVATCPVEGNGEQQHYAVSHKGILKWHIKVYQYPFTIPSAALILDAPPILDIPSFPAM